MRKPRTKTIRIRLSDEEPQILADKASEAGITQSALLRDHFGKVRGRNRNDEQQRIAMLNRINANLNMIARWCNTYKDSADTVEVVSHLAAIQRQIRGVAGYE